MIRMKELYTQMMSDGVMSDLGDFTVPWHDTQNVPLLDMGYYAHSANKIVSPLLFDMIDFNPQQPVTPLNEIQRTKIAGMLYRIYNRKWAKLWDITQAEYNPISNYDMVEEETTNHTIANQGTDTGTLQTSNTGTVQDSGTDTGTLQTAIPRPPQPWCPAAAKSAFC